MREAKKLPTRLRKYRKGSKKKHNHMKQRVVKRRGRVKKLRARVEKIRRVEKNKVGGWKKCESRG